MSEILFLAHRIPFPPDRGDKIRSHHILRALADLAPVHVGCFAESAADLAAERELKAITASHCMPMRRKPLPLAGMEALWRREPVSLAAFRHRGLRDWVANALRARPIDTIYVFSGQMGQYVPAAWQGRLVVDLVDVDSAKFDAYAAAGSIPKRWIEAREGRLLQRVEARLASRAGHTLLVSDAEAELLRSRLPNPQRANLCALGNGVDAALFDPAQVAPHPDLAGPGPHIVFTGQMDYAPNVEAAKRVILRLMPSVRAHHPNARFHVVGRAPVAELLALEGVNGAHIRGGVPDVKPFLAAADIVLAPLSIARGVQNKVLEAMAMARPVVLTPEAATGIPADDGRHFAVGDDDDVLIERMLALLAESTGRLRMGSAARAFVIERMGWSAMLASLPRIVGRDRDPETHRDAA
jgi:sugar transferase (PEP-CTERM/EpsH1 system associated)